MNLLSFSPCSTYCHSCKPLLLMPGELSGLTPTLSACGCDSVNFFFFNMLIIDILNTHQIILVSNWNPSTVCQRPQNKFHSSQHSIIGDPRISSIVFKSFNHHTIFFFFSIITWLTPLPFSIYLFSSLSNSVEENEFILLWNMSS